MPDQKRKPLVLYLLLLLLLFQIMWIGYGDILQTIYAFLGVLIILVTLQPAVRKYYTL